MPELPDVTVLKRYIDSTSLYQTIKDFNLTSEKLRAKSSRSTFKKYLIDQEFRETHQHGKYLFARLDNGAWLVFHFGMTGSLSYFKDPEEDPEYTKLLIHFDNGYKLAYINVRKLGRIEITQSVEDYVRKHDLGPHALSGAFSVEAFMDRLSDSRATIKSALMDQSRLAGIGNVYSDEILFQCGIRPDRRARELDDEELKKLYDVSRDVLITAIKYNADPETFPRNFLIPHRGTGEKCPKCGTIIQSIKVSGRSGYYCPQCQTESE